MKYPTAAEATTGSHEQICRWWRFLSSPTTSIETAIMRVISRRLADLGGWTPEISKKIGWKE